MSDNRAFPFPYVVRKKPLIAMCWATDEYDDLVAVTRSKIESFGIEYVRYSQPPNNEFAGLKLYPNTQHWVPFRDKIWIEFLKSCKGLYDKVLLCNADVHMEKPLLPEWLETPSIFWRCSMVSRWEHVTREIATHHMIIKPEDTIILETAQGMARDCKKGYEIENYIGKACNHLGSDARFEWLCIKRFIDWQEKIEDDDPQTFINPKPSKFMDTLGGAYYQHLVDRFTTTLDNHDNDPIFIISQYDNPRLEKYISNQELSWIDVEYLSLVTPKHGRELAWIFDQWMTHYPKNNQEYINKMIEARVKENVTFHQISVLRENCPSYFVNNKWTSKFLNEPVYQIDDWIVCPGVSWAAPASIWNIKPFMINNLNAKRLQLRRLFDDSMRPNNFN